jgi:hypothetical protein
MNAIDPLVWLLGSESGMSDNSPKGPRRPPRKAKQEGPPLWLSGAVIIGLIVLMVWVTDRFVAYDQLQKCVTAGRRACGPPVDVTK